MLLRKVIPRGIGLCSVIECGCERLWVILLSSASELHEVPNCIATLSCFVAIRPVKLAVEERFGKDNHG